MITWTVIRHIMLPVWTQPFAACRVIDMCKSRLQNVYHSLAYLPSKHTTVSAMPFPRSSLATRANANANSTHRIACRSLAISTGSLGKVACLKSCWSLCPLTHGNYRSMLYFSNFVTVGSAMNSKSARILAASGWCLVASFGVGKL